MSELDRMNVGLREIGIRRDRSMRAGVFDLDQDETGLHARDIHRTDPDRLDPEPLPDVEDPIPHGESSVDRHPHLVATVARIPGSRHIHVDVPDARASQGGEMRADSQRGSQVAREGTDVGAR